MQRSSSDVRPSAVVLGAAHWHAPLYREGLARRFTVAAVQDASIDAARAYAAPLASPAMSSVEDALAAGRVDIAFVFSPHDEMLAISRNLISKGIPFVIEKPVGVDVDDVRQIEAAARWAGVPVTVPLVQRGAPVDAWLRQVGEIAYERMAFIAGPPSRYENNGNPWMLDPARSGGGSLMNLGPHFVDMAVNHIGLPADVVRRQSTILHRTAVDDHATMVLTTSSGREAIIEVGYAFPESGLKRYCSFTAAGSNGFATVDTNGTATFTNNVGKTETANLDVDSDPLYDVFVTGVADALADGFAGLATLAELRTTMEIIWGSEVEGNDV